MHAIGPGLITVVAGVIGLAMVAVLVSKNAQTSQVFQGAGTMLSTIIGAAVAPVSGSSNNTFGSTTTTGGVTQ
jgi:purine-cytosine permease-like protein